MIDPTILCTRYENLTQLELVQHITWDFHLVSISIIFLVPFVIMLIISAANGTIGKPGWWQSCVIPYLFMFVLVLATLMGWLPLYFNTFG